MFNGGCTKVEGLWTTTIIMILAAGSVQWNRKKRHNPEFSSSGRKEKSRIYTYQSSALPKGKGADGS